MPVHPHHGAEGLEPERIGEPAQQLVPTVVMHNGLRHDCAKPGHSVSEPRRDPSTVEGQVSASGSSSHFRKFLGLRVNKPFCSCFVLPWARRGNRGVVGARQNGAASQAVRLGHAGRHEIRPRVPLPPGNSTWRHWSQRPDGIFRSLGSNRGCVAPDVDRASS
jgi:hypothetical protein